MDSLVWWSSARTVRCGGLRSQRGGEAGLFEGGLIPGPIAEARLAALMSSGPDRPIPLSQFTPADPAVGLVTGHRLPNSVGTNKLSLNVEVLNLMRSGLGPVEAIQRVVAENPEVDSGLIALSTDGRIHAADTRYVARFPDAGKAILSSASDPRVTAAVLHNAIRPWRGLALITAETALNVMTPPDAADREIQLVSGIPVVPGARNGIQIDDRGISLQLSVADAKLLSGEWHVGLGPHAEILAAGKSVGVALYEPYLVIRDGRLSSIDGTGQMSLPIRDLIQDCFGL